MTNFEAPIQGPMRSPHLDEDADRELDRLVDGGVATSGEAWKQVVKKHGTVYSDDPAESTVAIEADRMKVMDGHEDDSVPIAAPPKIGESDEQIRQRHRDALKARDSDPTSN